MAAHWQWPSPLTRTLTSVSRHAPQANRKVAQNLVPRRNIKVMADAMTVITCADATGMAGIVAARTETCGTARTVSAEIQSMKVSTNGCASIMATSTHAHLDIRLASRPAGKADKNYKEFPNKYCKGQNDLFQSKLGVMSSAAECKKKCTENPKCVSAEWYGSNPTQCDTSSTCTEKKLVSAPKAYGVISFVKQTKSGNGTDPPLSQPPDAANLTRECKSHSLQLAEKCPSQQFKSFGEFVVHSLSSPPTFLPACLP